MLTDMIVLAAFDPEKLERQLMRMKKKDLVDIIIQETNKYIGIGRQGVV